MSVNGQNVQVFCDGESRTYTIPEKIIDAKPRNEYVIINVEGGKYYQFKFEVDKFLVGDIYDENDEFVDSFASYVFGED
jgi:hypothetical protein